MEHTKLSRTLLGEGADPNQSGLLFNDLFCSGRKGDLTIENFGISFILIPQYLLNNTITQWRVSQHRPCRTVLKKEKPVAHVKAKAKAKAEAVKPNGESVKKPKNRSGGSTVEGVKRPKKKARTAK